jgi:hypothetical protein
MNLDKRKPKFIEAITFSPDSAWHEQDPNEYVVFSNKDCKGKVLVLAGKGTKEFKGTQAKTVAGAKSISVRRVTY